MSEKILVPVLGESITEATVSKWLKNEGDTVEADEPIVELETDKVNLEVPSPISGTLTEINSKDGSIVEVGALLGSVSENGSASKKTEEIEKIQPTVKEDNVIKLETQKDEEEPKIFEEKFDTELEYEKSLRNSLSYFVSAVNEKKLFDILDFNRSIKTNRLLLNFHKNQLD